MQIPTTTNEAQFWAIVVLIVTFAIDIIRRSFQRRWDKQDKAQELDIAHKERQEIARNVKDELELYNNRQALLLQATNSAVKEVVTVAVAAEHKQELKIAINESTVAAKDAFEVANTINEKLSEMSKAGLLNQNQEKERRQVDEIEAKKELK